MLPLLDVDTAPFRAKPFPPPPSRLDRARTARKGARNTGARNGRCIGYARRSPSNEVHVLGSIVTQLLQEGDLARGVRPSSIRYRKVSSRGRRNILFIVDTSGSMLSSERLSIVKGCVVSLLENAYVQRIRIAIVSCGGARARLALPFTTSAELAAKRIDRMRGGGPTPLVEALGIAASALEQLGGESAEVVLLSDGRYAKRSGVASERLLRGFGTFCKRRDVPIHLVDASAGNKTARQRIERLRRMLGAGVFTLDDLRADS